METGRDDGSTSVNSDQGDLGHVGILLDDLMGDAAQRALDIVCFQHYLLVQRDPSWPLGTGLKERG